MENHGANQVEQQVEHKDGFVIIPATKGSYKLPELIPADALLASLTAVQAHAHDGQNGVGHLLNHLMEECGLAEPVKRRRWGRIRRVLRG